MGLTDGRFQTGIQRASQNLPGVHLPEVLLRDPHDSQYPQVQSLQGFQEHTPAANEAPLYSNLIISK